MKRKAKILSIGDVRNVTTQNNEVKKVRDVVVEWEETYPNSDEVSKQNLVGSLWGEIDDDKAKNFVGSDATFDVYIFLGVYRKDERIYNNVRMYIPDLRIN